MVTNWKSNMDFSGLDDMFSSQDVRDNGEIKTVNIEDIVPFKQHTFKVKHDAKLHELADSIKEYGIMIPAIAFRNEDGLIELISGHRRMEASRMIGNDTLPVIIKNITRDEAIIIMGETNLQSRDRILISEKAYTYKAMYDAMKRQGKRTDITSSPVGTKLRTDDKLAKELGESRTNIQRYMSLTNLIPELMEVVDAGFMGIRPAVEVSNIDSINQKYIYDYYEDGEVRDDDGNITIPGTLPSLAQAIKLRKMAEHGELDEEAIREELKKDKPNQVEKFIIKNENLLSYQRNNNLAANAFEDKIIKALDFYDKYSEKLLGGKDAEREALR